MMAKSNSASSKSPEVVSPLRNPTRFTKPVATSREAAEASLKGSLEGKSPIKRSAIHILNFSNMTTTAIRKIIEV